jgi:hypothetical protein
MWLAGRELRAEATRTRGALLLATAGALLLLGGEPQTFGVGLGIVGIELAAHQWRRRRAGAAALAGMWLGFAVATLAGLGVGWLQWGPSLAETALSARSGVARDALSGAFGPDTWLGLVWPGVVHAPVSTDVDWWQLFQPGDFRVQPWNPRPYLGLCAVLLATVGVASRRARVVSLITLGALLFALGPQTPVLPLAIKVLPPLGLFRYPAKYLVPFALGVSLLVGHGAALAARHQRLRNALVAGTGTLAVIHILAVGLLGAFDDELNQRVATVIVSLGLRPEKVHAAELLQSAALQAFAPVALLTALAASRRLGRGWAWVVALDLLLALPADVEVGPPLHDVPSPLAPLADTGPTPPVLCVPTKVYALHVPAENESSSWRSAYAQHAWGASELQSCLGFTSGADYTSPMRSRTAAAMMLQLDRGKLGAARGLGCTHALTPAPFVDGDAPEADLPVARDAPLRVREIPDPVPLFFVARAPTLHPDERAAVNAVLGAETSAAIVAQLDDPGARWSGATLPDGAGVSALRGHVGPRHHIRLDIEGDGGAVVGARSSYRVGWRASQAGSPLPVLRAGAQQLAVVVDDVARGPVELSYEAPALGRSIFMAACGLAALAAFLLLSRRRRSDRAAAEARS